MCGSRKIIADVNIWDGSGGYAASEHHAVVFSKPMAFLFKGTVRGRLRAYICGDCGYTVLFTSNAPALYEAYLQSRTGRKG
jgi:hypothetical protein